MKTKRIKDNTFYNNTAAIAATVTVGLVTILVNYAQRLGANDWQITLLTALPALVAFLALIPGAYIIDTAKDKIKTTTFIALSSRIFLLLFALVPFLPKNFQVWVLVILVGLRNAPESIWSVGYQSIISDIFAYDELAQMMSIRNKIANITQLVTVITLSQLLAGVIKLDFNMTVTLQVIFILSACFGFLEVKLYRSLKPHRKPRRLKSGFIITFKDIIKTLPKQKRFLGYCLTVLPFYLTLMFPASLFNIYALRVLQANEQDMVYLTIVSTAFSVVSLPVWKKLINRFGNGACLFSAIIISSFVPVVYLLSKNMTILALWHALPGIAMAGINLLFFNLLIEMSPEKSKTTYMALFTSMVNLITFIMPLLCASFIKPIGLTWLLLVTFIARLSAGLWVAFRHKDLYRRTNTS